MRNLHHSTSNTRSNQGELRSLSSAGSNYHIAPAAFCLLVVGIVTACSSPTGSTAITVDPAHADDLLVVDCLLPPRVRQLGSQLTYLEAPRPAKTSAVECEIRGGEYTSWDRANFATSLKIWLPKAKEGDAQAQNYVGEIFEKGLGVTPDFQAAFEWYAKAAAQDYSQSQINLGQLYEQGLGVEADVVKAMNWYRKASGLEELQMAYVPSAEAVAELAGLRSELSEQTENAAELRQQLDVSAKDLAATRKQRDTRKREIAEEKEALARSKKELELANATLRAEQERIDAEAKRQKQASQSFAKKISESSSVDEMVAAGQAQVDWAAEMLSSLYAGLTSSETALDGRGSEVAAQTKRQAADVERERKELAMARTKLARDRSALEASQRSNATETKKLERERTALAQTASTATGAKEEFEANRAAQKRATAQLAIVSAAHERRATALAKQQSDIEAREQQQDKIGSERLALAATKDALAQERQQLKQQRLALEAESKNIKLSRTQLAQKSDTTATASQTLKTARAQLQRTQALVALQAAAQKNRMDTLKQREQEIAGREQSFARRSDELGRLDEEIAGLKAEAEQSRTDVVMVAQNNAVNFPGPSIQIIDPLIPLTRGLTITMSIPPTATRLLVGRVEAPAGLISLTINDREVKTDEKGIFRTDITLADGDTPVTLVAIDRDGKRGDRNFMLRASENVRGASIPKRVRKPQVKFGNYYALVIGNNDYGKLPKLETAIEDATAVGQVLDQRYGFKVTNLINANRYEILSALNELRAKLTEDDNLLIYYAGHGELDKVNMRGHWLPVDAEPGSSANWISNIALTDILNTMNARHVMVVADSCYSGALTRSSLARLEAGLTTEARESWQRAMVQKRSRTALTSGGIAPVLDAGGGKHSIFAKAFIDTLSANADVIEGQRLFQELSAQVTWAAEAKNFEQIPQYAPIKFAGHESGEFFFVPER
ncbi:MAG: TPR repeat protein [Myxococcota bacterium]|jgi:TPR repeat protein